MGSEAMRLVHKMTLDPMRCIGCGKGNTPDSRTGEIGPFVDLEMEVGWNDHAYLCTDCGSRVGALSGMIAEDEAKDLRRQLQARVVEAHELQSSNDDLSQRLRATQARLLRVG